MATSCRKRKYKEENRSFLPEWEEDFAFIDKEGSLVRVQSKKTSCAKLHNIHFVCNILQNFAAR